MIGLNNSICQIFIFSFTAIALFWISIILGFFLYNIEFSQRYKRIYLNGFLGLFTILTAFSLYSTDLKSINLVAVPLFAYLFLKNKSRFKMENFRLVEFLHSLYVFPIVFALYACFEYPDSIENDVRFYAKITYSLSHLGQENLYHFYNNYEAKFNGAMPYHYFELWLASILNFSTGTKSIIALRYFAYPFLISFFLYGLSSVFNNRKPLYFLLVLFLTLLPLYRISFIHTGFMVYTDFWLRPNFIPYYFCFLAIIFALEEKQWLLFGFTAALTMLTSVILIPSLFGGLILLFGILMFSKKIERLDALKGLTPGLFVLLAMLIFYISFSPGINVSSDKSILTTLTSSLKIWKSVVFIFSILLFESLILLSIVLFLNQFIIKANSFSILIFFCLTQLVVGLLVFQLLNQLDNSYQFAYFAFSSLGFVFIYAIALSISKLNSYLFLIAFSAIMIISFLTSSDMFAPIKPHVTLEQNNLLRYGFSENWLKRVQKFLQDRPRGSFYMPIYEQIKVNPKARHCLTNQQGSFLAYLTDNCNLPALTCPDFLFHDRAINNKSAFVKAEHWYGVFSRFNKNCNPLYYLKSKEVDYFITTDTIFKSNGLLEVESDYMSSYCLVALK